MVNLGKATVWQMKIFVSVVILAGSGAEIYTVLVWLLLTKCCVALRISYAIRNMRQQNFAENVKYPLGQGCGRTHGFGE